MPGPGAGARGAPRARRNLMAPAAALYPDPLRPPPTPGRIPCVTLTAPRRALTAALLLAGATAPAAAQRAYRLEASLAGAYQTFDSQLQLGSTVGGVGRLGYWVTGPLSLEVEAGVARPKTDTQLHKAVSTSQFGGWILGNFPVGGSTFLIVKGGYAHLGFGTCPTVSVPGAGPCGAADVVQGGAGVRIALSPTLFMRYEGVVQRSTTTLKFTNLSLQGGVSLMLGSRPLVDSDGDGVYDRSDACEGTRIGALVDKRGCPTDTDGDGVPDGVDRCPNTPSGATPDQAGCPRDSDGDGYLDGLDECPDTPEGALVDRRGCPSDSDGDGVLDGLDRCTQTPAGATVDALGCPGDQDADGVFDGLDRCPDTRQGAAVDTNGCPTEPEPVDTIPEQRFVLPGQVWTFRQADLDTAIAQPVLDSVVAALQEDPRAFAEVNGFAYDRLVPVDNTRLSQQRAEAVRVYILRRGIPVTRVTAIGRGSEPLLVADTTETARVTNRRVEIRVTHNP